MRNKNRITILLSTAFAAVGIAWAADHIEAPSVTGTTSDITDYYAFQSEADNDNMVFVANLQPLLDPAATANASFDEQVMVEFNIDNDGDLVEDLVIQAVVENGQVKVYGPIAPSMTGATSVKEGDVSVQGAVTQYGQSAMVAEQNGIKAFAGPRDDPFFMDFAQFTEIVSGNASSFNDPGSDTFAGTNVMSIVIEVPKSSLGNADVINTWVESKRRS